MATPRDIYAGQPILGDHFHDTLMKIWYRLLEPINAVVTEGSSLPYGSDSQAITYYGATNNIETIVYSKGGSPVKTRTFTYVNGGAANDDLLSGTVDA